jgi:curved DNA-binding protein CbpA
VTHYEVLGVSPDASDDAIRRAYLDRARRHHPDFHTMEGAPARAAAEAEMRRINEAWHVLSDRSKRLAYDAGTAFAGADPTRAPQGQAAPTGPVWRPGSGTAHPDFVPFSDEDEFEDEEERAAYLDSLDDTPYVRARRVPAWQQLLPVAMLLSALASLCVGLVVSLAPLLGLGVMLLVLSGLAFVLTPMLAVMRSYDPDPD